MLLSNLNSAFTLAFVVTSMFGLGLGLTLRELLAPLKNRRLVIAALLINFILLPGLALLITTLVPLDPSSRIGIILLSTVSGSPLGVKAAQIALGDVTIAGTLVGLQVLATVLYIPIALPHLIPGIAVNSEAVTTSLFLQVLLPLALGLLMNFRYGEEAEVTLPIMNEISNISLFAILIINLTNVPQILGLFGSGALLTVIIILGTGLAAGFYWPGLDIKLRKSLGLVSAQRNYAAAFVIAQESFAHQTDVFVMLLMAALFSMIGILLVSGEFRRHAIRKAKAI